MARTADFTAYRAAVVQATIRLGRCLDLTDIRYTEAIRRAFDGLREAYAAKNLMLPVNRGKARRLDCLVINYVAEYVFEDCETVRAPFLEGPPIFEGSALLSASHIQIVVRKPIGIVTNIRPVEEHEVGMSFSNSLPGGIQNRSQPRRIGQHESL